VKPRVFIEPSVVSYRAAEPSRDLLVAARQRVTAEWWDTTLPAVVPLISPIVIDEISKGDRRAAGRRLRLVRGMGLLEVTAMSRDLAGAYLEEIPVPGTAAIDALHMGIASVHRVDYLVTWNCRHIANARVIIAAEKVNERRGLPVPVICTPEVMMELRQ